MRIIARRTLHEFWERYPETAGPLQAWYHDAAKATWKTPSDIKAVSRNASILGNNRAVFNIRGNEYRLVIAINYSYGIVSIRFIGTHQEYDKVNAEEV